MLTFNAALTIHELVGGRCILLKDANVAHSKLNAGRLQQPMHACSSCSLRTKSDCCHCSALLTLVMHV